MSDKPYISNGNIKVKALIFNQPQGKTCKPGLKCRQYCFAKKAERQYKQVRPCRERNHEASKGENFVSDMINFLKRKRKKYFRVHESGDFYSQKYILKWWFIASKFPDKIFYAYTKRDDNFTKEILDAKPDNFTLIWSVDGLCSGDVNANIPSGFDKVAISHEVQTNCDAQTKDDVKCMQDCFKCIDKENNVIIFKKH